MSDSPLHILALEAQNVKRLKTVAIVPRSKVVRINGKNGSGKTSTLDAILWALGGKRVVQMQPVREGQERAVVKLAIGGKQVEYIVTRTFSAGGTTHMTVEDPNGGLFKKPQELLDELFGALSMDPYAFIRANPKARIEALKAIVKLDIDLDELERLNQGDYEKRQQINRDIKTMEERVRMYAGGVNSNMDIRPIDTAPMFADMTKASEANSAIERLKFARKNHEEQLASDQADVAELDTEIDRLIALRDKRQREVDKAKEEMQGWRELPAPIDVTELAETIKRAQAENSARELQRVARERYAQQKKELEDAYARSQQLTDMMEARTQIKAEAIAKAEYPVPGLSFSEQGGVMFNGIPFDQASGAEQLRVSFAMAAAVRPKMPVVLIKDGSLLDDDSMKLLEELAEQYDAQVWIERVGKGPVGITLEEGEVVAVDGVPVDS